jgi:hypothetical protein
MNIAYTKQMCSCNLQNVLSGDVGNIILTGAGNMTNFILLFTCKWTKELVRKYWQRKYGKHIIFNDSNLHGLSENVICRRRGCNLCSFGAENGIIDFIEWGIELEHDPEHTMVIAAHQGYLEVVQWCHKNDIKWNPICTYTAVTNGNVDVLRFAFKHVWRNLVITEEAYCMAARRGHLGVLQLAHQMHPDDLTKMSYISEAIAYGNLPILKWAIANGYVTGILDMSAAVFHNQIGILAWMREYDSHWKDLICRWCCEYALGYIPQLDGNFNLEGLLFVFESYNVLLAGTSVSWNQYV